MDEGGIKAVEEERRLAYVGLTRAKRAATVCYAANRRVYNQWAASMPSRFIEELPAEHTEFLQRQHVPEPQMSGWFDDLRAGGRGPGFARMRAAGKAPLIDGQARVLATELPKSRHVIAVGQRIFHEKFGYGQVLAVEGNKLRDRLRQGRHQEGHRQLRRAGVTMVEVPLWQSRFVVPGAAVALFLDELEDAAISIAAFEVQDGEERADGALWRVELMHRGEPDQQALAARLAPLAERSGIGRLDLTIAPLATTNWLARAAESFPPRRIGRFWIHGSHVREPAARGRGRDPARRRARVRLRRARIDPGLPAGARRSRPAPPVAPRPGRRLRLGHPRDRRRQMLARRACSRSTTIPTRSPSRGENARRNGVAHRVRTAPSDGYRSSGVRAGGPYDLILRQHPRRPVVRHGARSRPPSGARRHGDPRRPVRPAGAAGDRGPPRRRAAAARPPRPRHLDHAGDGEAAPRGLSGKRRRPARWPGRRRPRRLTDLAGDRGSEGRGAGAGGRGGDAGSGARR